MEVISRMRIASPLPNKGGYRQYHQSSIFQFDGSFTGVGSRPSSHWAAFFGSNVLSEHSMTHESYCRGPLFI
jgi:hypothetical protein